MTTPEQLERFRALLEQEQNEKLARDYPGVGPYIAEVKLGSKFAKVDIGPPSNMSGRYMVELGTGDIYGIKGYGVVHRGHRYGNIQHVEQWDWSGYTGWRRP